MARPATLRDRSSSVIAPDRWMSSSVCALIENGTSTRLASRFVAVTVMLSSLVVAAADCGACWALAMLAAPIARPAEGKASSTALVNGRGFIIDVISRVIVGIVLAANAILLKFPIN